MSYVGPPYAFDIFISYSHGMTPGQNAALLRQWSQAFATVLEAELRLDPRLANELTFFLDQHRQHDQRLDPMEELTKSIRDRATGSALLTVLMSPHYLSSTWCEDERGWWIAGQKQHALPADGRIAVARVLPSTSSWPRELLDERGHELIGILFHEDSAKGPTARPYAWPVPELNTGGRFRERVIDLVGILTTKLDALKTQLDAKREQRKHAQMLANDDVALYLHGRAGAQEAFFAAHAELLKAGFSVTPNEPDPVEGDPAATMNAQVSRIASLRACDAMLLLAPADGRALDADMIVIGRNDRNSARATSKRPLPCAVLNTTGPELATPPRKAAAQRLQIDWIDADDAWPAQVRRWLQNKASQLESPE